MGKMKVKKFQESEFKKLILARQFREAEEIIQGFKFDDMLEKLFTISFDFNNRSIYNFICYLINKERDNEKLSKYHNLASEILTVAIPYLDISFKKGVNHLKKAMELNKKNIKFKESFLQTYQCPDAEGYISNKETKKIAEEILKKKPKSKIAKETLEDLEMRKRGGLK